MHVAPITTQRLTLREYQESDISAWQRWDTDPIVQEHLPEPRNEPVSGDVQREYLEECLAEEHDAYWSIVWNENQQIIGTISLNDIHPHHQIAELNIVIGEKEYWGKGIATEAIGAVVEHAFSTMNIRRIMAEFEVGNVGLQKAALANNFVEECRSHASRIKNGSPIDTFRYYRLR